MSEQPQKPDRMLSEISHLFLSSVRERQAQGPARPRRIPPPPALTADEMLHVDPELSTSAAVRGAPVVALLGAHLGANQSNRAREYAAHVCASGQASRVGLIQLDAGELRISRIERACGTVAGTQPDAAREGLDARRISDALQELSWEIDRWVIVLDSPRSTDARTLLRQIDRWVLLTTSDHDGVVASYRTLKGLADLRDTDGAGKPVRPKLSLALLDAHDEAEADHVLRKLSSACAQFLDWNLEPTSPVRPAEGVSIFEVLVCRGTRDKAHSAATPHWDAVVDFILKLRSSQERETPMPEHHPAPAPLPSVVIAPNAPAHEHRFATPPPTRSGDDVIELPQGDAAPSSIVAAVLQGCADLAESSVRAPMCADARLAVSRDHRLVLIASARQGLADLLSIGHAYRWLIENRPLITMALPQFAIDAHAMPQLRLLVEQTDASAELLKPILQSGNVTVLAYRTLRWAGKTGLLLQAA